MNRLELISNIENPRQLEKLYRDNKTGFKTEFNLIYPELKDHQLADYWHERLNYESTEISWGSGKELIFVIIAGLIAGLIAKIPAMFNIDQEFFYPRNIGFIVFPVLTAYFIWRNGLGANKIIFAAVPMLVAAIFINSFPDNNTSDTLILSCIHLPLILWAILGYTYGGAQIRDPHKKLEFLRYNGDLAIMTGLLLIAGVALTGITIGLFSVIDINIEKIYFDYVAIFGLSAAPLVGSYITQTNPNLVNKVSPVIAKIFTPLVLIMLVIYLGAILYTGKDPYNDRDFLMTFNGLLIGVMAIILFSVAETFKKNENRIGSYMLLALSVVTIIINGIAISAILFRISEWGLTPNRMAVFGGNLLMLVNLCLVTFRLFKNITKKAAINDVENSISNFLPVYILWAIVVTFVFPILFHFK